jgi:diguanylate cyclase (GGDEF)-like protein
LVLLFSVVVEINNNLFTQHAKALNGQLELSGVDLSHSEPIPLAGEWQFYWQQLVLSDSFEAEIDSPFDLLKTPRSWETQTFLGQAITPSGFATYRLRINIKPTTDLLALSVPVMGTAYRLYVNQTLVDQAGQVGTNKQNSVAQYAPNIVAVSAPNGQLDVILQVSNYELAWGGQWFPITLATADKQFQVHLKKLIRSVSIAAIFFTIAILSLFHFALRPTDLLPFLLALSCICLGLREVETSHLLYITDSVSLSFNTAIRINFLTFYLAIPLFTAYFRLSYPGEFRRLPVIAICSISVVFIVTTLMTPPVIFSYWMAYFQYFALVTLIYGLYSILLAAYRKRTGARLMALGSILLFSLSINDIFNSLGIISTGTMAGLGLLSFALCQNYLSYVRFINDSRAMQTLAVQANQDPLTLLFNRRGLMEAIKYIDSEQRHNSARFCIMLIDFDHFKRLNDTLGHDAGDVVLAEGSKIMQSVIRKEDLAARWGGEEFVIILPNTHQAGAKILAEKLRIKLSKGLSMRLQYTITVSVGVAQCLDNEHFAACLKRADNALYQAKEEGRNRVVLAS